MLSARDVTFGYGRPRHRAEPRSEVVRHVWLDLPPGGLLGLLGPNGSGKTTLLRLLAGLLTPGSGIVTLDGIPLADWRRTALARRIAVVPQETHPAFEYSVLEMVLMGRYPHLDAFAVEGPGDVAIAREALAATGVAGLEARDFGTLSGGEKQRVVIASALAQQGDILLLDEPTTSLDPGSQLGIVTLLRTLQAERGISIALATHDLNLAASICRDLVLIGDGRVLAAGSTREVLTTANIRRLYGVEADVAFHDAAGHLTVVPLARSPR